MGKFDNLLEEVFIEINYSGYILFIRKMTIMCMWVIFLIKKQGSLYSFEESKREMLYFIHSGNVYAFLKLIWIVHILYTL